MSFFRTELTATKTADIARGAGFAAIEVSSEFLWAEISNILSGWHTELANATNELLPEPLYFAVKTLNRAWSGPSTFGRPFLNVDGIQDIVFRRKAFQIEAVDGHVLIVEPMVLDLLRMLATRVAAMPSSELQRDLLKVINS